MDDLHPLDRSLKRVVGVAQNMLSGIKPPVPPCAHDILLDHVKIVASILLKMQRKPRDTGAIPQSIVTNSHRRAHNIFRACEIDWDENSLTDFQKLIKDIKKWYDPIGPSGTTKPLP